MGLPRPASLQNESPRSLAPQTTQTLGEDTPRLWALRGIPSAERDLFPLSDSVKGRHEASQSGMGKFLTKHPEALRIMVGGASSGACGVEEFLRDEVSLFW